MEGRQWQLSVTRSGAAHCPRTAALSRTRSPLAGRAIAAFRSASISPGAPYHLIELRLQRPGGWPNCGNCHFALRPALKGLF